MAYEPTPGTAPVVIGGDVQFSLTVDGHVQRFSVSHEALEDHFSDPAGGTFDRLEAFERGRERIYAAAAAKLGNRSGNVIGVGTHDF
ncbi:DUF1488 family protein [Burkholderia thailandensis]|uniref:DUF1488 family protein n=1 Tax=Burkholderia thailandensis TaxID=57975 RepID=UPI003F8FE0F4